MRNLKEKVYSPIIKQTFRHDPSLQIFPSMDEDVVSQNALSIVHNAKKTRIDEVMNDCERKLHELDVFLEQIKCKLALIVDFNLRDLFKFLDHNGKGYVDVYDLERLTEFLKIKFIENREKDLVRSLLRLFDKDHDDKLLFTDICKIFLSVKQQYQELVVDRPQYY